LRGSFEFGERLDFTPEDTENPEDTEKM